MTTPDTYTDQARGAPDANRILRLLRARGVSYGEALDLLCRALAAEYSRGRADGARDMGERLALTREDTP